MSQASTHAIDWFEIPCTDIGRAQAFYERVLGRKMESSNYGGPGMTMVVFPAAGGSEAVRGALMAGPGTPKPSAAGTVIYLNADPSLSGALQRVPAAGGRIDTPLVTLPSGMGLIAHIVDSEGNRIGLHAMA